MDTSLSDSTARRPASEWDEIKKAIRDYLRHEYASAKYDLEHEPVPLKISTYSGKGVGHFETAEDGRADWSPEFKRYIFNSADRRPEKVELRFGYREFDAAMRALERQHPHWHTTIVALECEGQPLDDVVETFKRDHSTIKRYRQKAFLFLFRRLVVQPSRPESPVKVKIVQVVD